MSHVHADPNVKKETVMIKRPNVTMQNGRVMVKRFEPEKVSKGGIVLAEQAQYERYDAKVVAVGKGSFVDLTPDGEPRYEPMPVKVGDHVLFAKYTGVEWLDPDTAEKYQILLVEDILMVIND